MPTRAGRNCTRPGCHGVVRDGVCSVCGPLRRANDRAYDEQRGTAHERGYTATWRKLRKMQLAREPLCRECAKHGRIIAATEAHHARPKRDGGPDAFENLMSLCKTCHSRITAQGG